MSELTFEFADYRTVIAFHGTTAAMHEDAHIRICVRNQKNVLAVWYVSPRGLRQVARADK